MFCQKCGKQIKKNAKFCEHCGTAVTLNTNSTEDSSVQENSEDESWLKEIPLQTRIAFGLRGVFFLLAIPVFCLPFIALGNSSGEETLSFSLYDLIGFVKDAKNVDILKTIKIAIYALFAIIGGATVLSYSNRELAALVGIVGIADLIYINHACKQIVGLLSDSANVTPALGFIIVLILFLLGTLLNALEIIHLIRKITNKPS